MEFFIIKLLGFIDLVSFKLQEFFTIVYAKILPFLVVIKGIFFFGPRVALGEERSSWVVVFLPFVNSYKLLIKAVGLLPKERFLVSLLNLFKGFISLGMSVLFFIAYTTAYTYPGFIIYRILPLLSFILFRAILDDMQANPSEEGDLTLLCYNIMQAFKYTIGMFAIIPTSCTVLALCAKGLFTRAILIDTVGLLSYKIYIGENPGGYIAALAQMAPKILITTGAIVGSSAVLDDYLNALKFRRLEDSCRRDGVPMTFEQKEEFIRNCPTTLGTLSNAVTKIMARKITVTWEKTPDDDNSPTSAPSARQFQGPIFKHIKPNADVPSIKDISDIDS